MLLAIVCVGSFATFVEFGSRVAKHKSNVDVWVLLLDQNVPCAVLDCPNAFPLKIPKSILLRQFEVGSILRLPRWDFVVDTISLIQYFNLI